MSELVTAATVERFVLEPGLDARAANLSQYNPSPEIDSALERAMSLVAQLPPGVRRGAIIAELRAAARSNLVEGALERRINAFADSLVVDLRSIERNGASRRHPLAAKAIARRLRTPLTHIARPAGVSSTELVRSCRLVTETIQRVPRAQLLAPAVRHELGAAKFALLERLVAEHVVTERCAGGVEASGAQNNQGSGPDHGAR